MESIVLAARDWLRKGFEDDMLHPEKRDPLWIFTIPGLDEGSFGVVAPSMSFFSQLTLILAMNMSIAAIFGSIIYTCIIQHRGKTFTYLLGYGILIPISMQIPFHIIEFAKMRNHVLRMALSVIPNNVTFRCIEAMHDTSPVAVEASLVNYATYFTSLHDFQWDPKTKSIVPISGRELWTNAKRLIVHSLCLSLCLSLLMHYDYKPFPSDVVLDTYNLDWSLFKPGQLANNYIYAVTLFFLLSYSFNLAVFGFNMMGSKTMDCFRNPLWTSKSPSDFWNAKWNLIIHSVLKRGAYAPVRKAGYPAWVAILTAFVASGLLHDYVWTIIFYKSSHDYDPATGRCDDSSPCFVPLRFKQTAFFFWCGITMLLERPVGRSGVVNWMSRRLPPPIVSTLVVLTALPFAHWYAGDWIVGRYFAEFSNGVFRIDYIRS